MQLKFFDIDKKENPAQPDDSVYNLPEKAGGYRPDYLLLPASAAKTAGGLQSLTRESVPYKNVLGYNGFIAREGQGGNLIVPALAAQYQKGPPAVLQKSGRFHQIRCCLQ